MKIRTLLSLAFVGALFACGHNHPSEAEMKLYKEAAKYHNEAVGIQGELMGAFEEAKASGEPDKVKELEDRFEQWNASLVEVPYNEEHVHHGDHEHHSAPANVTAEELRDSQKAMLEEIKAIRSELQAVMQATQDEAEAAEEAPQQEG